VLYIPIEVKQVLRYDSFKFRALLLPTDGVGPTHTKNTLAKVKVLLNAILGHVENTYCTLLIKSSIFLKLLINWFL